MHEFQFKLCCTLFMKLCKESVSVGTTTMPVGAAKVSGNIGIIFLTSDDLTAKFTFCGIVPNTRKVFSGSREEETIATNSP